MLIADRSTTNAASAIMVGWRVALTCHISHYHIENQFYAFELLTAMNSYQLL